MNTTRRASPRCVEGEAELGGDGADRRDVGNHLDVHPVEFEERGLLADSAEDRRIALARAKRLAADQASLTDALEAADRLQRLIEQLLAMARAEAAEADGPQQSDLVACAQNLVERWAGRAKSAGARLHLEPIAETARVPLASALAEQILKNLIGNALRHGARTITLAVRLEANFAVLSVEDDGPGLPENLIRRPFERFARGPHSEGVGSGVGLSIVKALAARAGGDATLANMPGGGLRVSVRQPRLDPAVA